MCASNATDPTVTPYNTAYVRDDRSHLYGEYDLDPAHDGGTVCPETGERDVPPDYDDRREAILSFYGNRCGRCLTELAVTGTGEADLGYVYSLATATGETDRWALEHLVAVCEPCYEVLTIRDPDELDSFRSAYEESQQFPQWLGDPRVAVERIPLSGRELWLREQLAERGPRSQVPRDRRERPSINEPVATTACLARTTPAATAVEFGERFAADAWQPLPETQRLTDRWELLDEDRREAYERRAENWQALVDESFRPAGY